MADSTKRKKGFSLAKGPVGIVGLVLLAYGILAFIFGSADFGARNVPDGPINGETFLGLETNGWTNLLFIVGGALLAFGAPLHWAAKGMAAIVGLVFGAAAVISLVSQWNDGNWGVFGIFAANNWTTLAWGAIATLLLILALLPRINRRKHERAEPVERDRERRAVEREPAADREGRFEREREPRDERVTDGAPRERRTL